MNYLTRFILIIISIVVFPAGVLFAAEHQLTVSRHTSIALSNSEVDQILSDSTLILKADDDGLVGIADV
ncbi:MAG: hypothetical protein GY761_06535, partial [Hyphomicrobiales bacterium]|nr:hypothetical protein [Hyphomicrobiales bacterium]